MWPFKKKHKHDWIIVDKRVFVDTLVHLKKGTEFQVEGVATLKRCSSCGEEAAYKEPAEKDWWMGPLRDFYGDMDPFLYKNKYGIKEGGRG